MSTKINLDSLNRLNVFIRDNILTSYDLYRDYRLECDEKFEYLDDPEDPDKILCKFTVNVHKVKYALTGEIGMAPDGNGTYEKKDYNDYQILNTKRHEVFLSYPRSNLGLTVDKSNGTRKTNINTARKQKILKFTKASIYLQGNSLKQKQGYFSEIAIRPFDITDKVWTLCNKISIGKDIVLDLTSLLKEYNILDNSKWLNKMTNGEKVSYRDYLIDEDNKEIKPIDSETMEEIKNYYINERTLRKLEIISEGEFQRTAPYLDANLLDFVLAAYFSDYERHNEKEYIRYCERYNMQTPFDYTFMDAADSVMYELADYSKKEKYGNKTTKSNILQLIYRNYARLVNKNGKQVPKEELSIKALQNTLDSCFYKMQSDNFRNVQSTKDSSALTILSQARTIYFYDKFDQKEQKYSSEWKQQRLFNKSFNGVLEPTITNDSALINKKNEFALGTTLDKNGDILIDVVEIKTGKKIQLEYYDFCKEPLLARDCYDEFNHQAIRNPHTGKYSILQYYNYKNYDELPENVRYARDKLNELTYATALIPNTNRMVGTRVTLSSHFLTQSIPVQEAAPTVVHTKMPKYIYEHADPERLEYNLEEGGKVIDIKNQLIKVKTDSGKIKIFGKDDYYSKTSMGTNNQYIPQVKIGQRVSKGTILETSNSFVDGEFTTQVPLFVMFGTYKAWEHEDGILLTQSAARKFGHVNNYERVESVPNKYFISFRRNTGDDTTNLAEKKLVKSISEKTNKPVLKMKTKTHNELDKMSKIDRKYNLDEWSLVKKGSVVTAGSILFEYIQYDNQEIYSSFAQSFTEVLKYLTPTVKQIKVPYDIRNEGTVTEVQLFVNGDEELFDEGTSNDTPTLEEFKKSTLNEFKYPGKFGIDPIDNREAYKHFKKRGEETIKEDLMWREESLSKSKSLWTLSDKDNLFELRVVIQYVDELSNERLGSKLSNYYASKGVNVHIIPDEYAPIVEGLYDAKGNPQRIEGIISTATTLSRQNPGQIDDCKLGLIGVQTWVKLVKPYKTPTQKIEKILDKIYPPVNGKRSWKWEKLKQEGEKYGYCRIEVDYFDKYYTHQKITEIMNDMGLGNYRGDFKVFLPEFNTTTQVYNTVGVTSMMRLHFIPEHKASIAPDGKPIFDEDNNITYGDLLNKKGGQKLGQMEIMASAANGEFDVMKRAVTTQGDTSKRANIYSALIGLGIRLN